MLSPSSGPLYPIGSAPPAVTPSKSPIAVASPDLEIKDARQSEFHEEQTIVVTRFITGIGVSVRTREISKLNALGFARPLARRLPGVHHQLAALPRGDIRLQGHAAVAGAGHRLRHRHRDLW